MWGKKCRKGKNNTQNKSTAILNPLASFVIIGGVGGVISQLGTQKKGSEKNRMMQLNWMQKEH